MSRTNDAINNVKDPATQQALHRLFEGLGLKSLPVGASFTPAAAGANVSEVTIQVTDDEGLALAGVFGLDVWLSDAADGEGLTGTTASGTVTAKSASGTVLGTYTAKKALRVQTKDDGTFILEITDTSKTGFYVAAAVPATGAAAVSRQLVSADYGSA